jgi:hypothetical protein
LTTTAAAETDFAPREQESEHIQHSYINVSRKTKALFRSIFLDFDTVAFLLLFDKHCPIIE